jgi:hypothetical protein
VVETARCRLGLGALTLLVALALAAHAEHESDVDPGEEPPAAFEQTPPRLAYVDGEVSFSRGGEGDWAPAPLNLALARGDRLYARDDSNLELQIGPRAFLRAGDGAELGLDSHEPDFLQFRVTSGIASLDLRSLPPGHTIELDTPNAAFTIEETGYYRLDIDGDTTTLTCRRGGNATIVLPNGAPLVVGSSEQVVVEGVDVANAESYAAPELDDWDLWNYRRTDRQLDSPSARYVPADVYGVSDLDYYGSWRTVAPYGPIWVPAGVRAGWTPYGFGRWIWDPRFGWTWLDDAPWGWAPFHYGRWIFVHGHWAWAPGPVVVRSYYAPALVVFYGGHHGSLGWVPLGWGEPCRPWWGPRGWHGRPHWLGWGGPRITQREHANERWPGAFVAVPGKSFGREPVARVREASLKPTELAPLDGALAAPRVPFASPGGKGERPPKHAPPRRVVSTRKLEAAPVPGVPEPRIVPAPKTQRKLESYSRPPFGREAGEERAVPKPPPRYEVKPEKVGKIREPKPVRIERLPVPKVEPRAVELPGEPANRVYRGRGSEAGGRGARTRGAPIPAPAPAAPPPVAPRPTFP